MTGISRRALLSGTAAFGAGALAGCAGMNTAQPRGVGPLTNLTKEPVRLRFGVRPGATELAWATVIAKDFQRMHPNITVAVEQNAQITDIRTLVTGALSRDLPDIMFTTDVNVQTQSSKGLLLDLTPYMQAYGMKQSDFLGKIMQLGQWKGRQYVVPRGADQVIVAYNPETFTKAGLPQPRLGWRWPEFLRACAQLQRKNGHGFWAMGDGATYTGYPIFIPFMRGWGGEVANADGSHATLDSPKVVEGVAQMMDFFGKYSAAFQAPPIDPFLGGHAAMSMMVRSNVFVNLVNADRTKWTTAFKPRFVNFPLFPTPKIGAGMTGWSGAVTTKHPHETAAFLIYTLSKRGQRAFSKASGEVPVRRDLAADTTWQDVLNFDGTVDQRAFVAFGADQSLPPDNIPLVANGQMSSAIADALDAIRLRTKTVQAAMTGCNKIVNQTIVGLQ